MADPFVRAVIEVDILLTPALTESGGIYGIAVILAGDEAAVRAYLAYRLVVATVSVLHLADLCSCSCSEELIAHADPADGLLLSEGLTDVLDGDTTLIGVARAIREEEPVEINLIKIIVPGYAVERDLWTDEVADNIVLRAAVYEHDLLRPITIDRDLLGRSFSYKVARIGVIKWDIFATLEENLPLHRALFAKGLSQLTRINPRETEDLLTAEPITE